MPALLSQMQEGFYDTQKKIKVVFQPALNSRSVCHRDMEKRYNKRIKLHFARIFGLFS